MLAISDLKKTYPSGLAREALERVRAIDRFLALELPADFLEDVAAAKAAFQAAISGQANAVGDHISACEELDDALDRGVQIVRKLTGLVEVRYANNPGKLAEWTAASHIERAPRRSKVGTPPPTPPSPAPPPTSRLYLAVGFYEDC